MDDPPPAPVRLALVGCGSNGRIHVDGLADPSIEAAYRSAGSGRPVAVAGVLAP